MISGRYQRELGAAKDRVLADSGKKPRIVRIHSTFTMVSSLYPVITLV